MRRGEVSCTWCAGLTDRAEAGPGSAVTRCVAAIWCWHGGAVVEVGSCSRTDALHCTPTSAGHCACYGYIGTSRSTFQPLQLCVTLACGVNKGPALMLLRGWTDRRCRMQSPCDIRAVSPNHAPHRGSIIRSPPCPRWSQETKQCRVRVSGQGSWPRSGRLGDLPAMLLGGGTVSQRRVRMCTRRVRMCTSRGCEP